MKHLSAVQSVAKLETGVTFGSVCSGIEAASVAWEPLGWKADWFAEIEPFPSAVLAHHWPEVPNLGDMAKIRDRIAAGDVSAPDVLVGGTPCQAFSVAGARKSLDDARGQLTLEYVRLLNEIDAARSIRGEQPAIAVWENVPGALSTKDNAFGCLLGALAGEECELQPSGKKWTNAGCVFGPKRAVAWRILDAQYFGLAQRRKRVFVVASAREGFNPAEVLFEFDSMRRDSAPSRSAGKDTAGAIGTGFASSSFAQYRPFDSDAGTLKRSGGDIGGDSENLIVGTVSGKDIFPTLQSSMGTKLWLGNQEAFSGDYFISQPVNSNAISVVNGTQDPITQDNQAFPVGRNYGQENAVYSIMGNWIGRKPENGGNATEPGNNIAPCLTKTDRHAVSYGLVRRLIPKECERLQGFPDNHTEIPYRNKPVDKCPDGPRYAACGNSMAVSVMKWIGERIAEQLAKK